jgi:Cohesin domain
LLVGLDEVVDVQRVPGESPMNAATRSTHKATMMLLLVAVLVAAPACGGGGGGSTSTGGSPSPLAASFVPDQGAPAANTVALEQGSKANDVVTVNVTLTNTNGVFGLAFEIPFDAIHAVYLGYTAGTALEQGSNTPIYNVTTNVNGSSGRVIVGVARTGGTKTNVAGTATVVGLQFRVKSAGTFPVTLDNMNVYDNQQPTPQPLSGILWFAGALKAV